MQKSPLCYKYKVLLKAYQFSWSVFCCAEWFLYTIRLGQRLSSCNVLVSSRTSASRVSSRSRPKRSRAHPCKHVKVKWTEIHNTMRHYETYSTKYTILKTLRTVYNKTVLVKLSQVISLNLNFTRHHQISCVYYTLLWIHCNWALTLLVAPHYQSETSVATKVVYIHLLRMML